MKKCLLTGVLTIIAPGTPLQLLAAVLICTADLLFVFKFAPYIGDSADTLASLTSGSLFITFLLGFYEATAAHYSGDPEERTGRSEQGIRQLLGPLLITINTIPLVYFVVANIWYAAVVLPGARKKQLLETKQKPGVLPSSVVPAARRAGVELIQGGAPAESENADAIRSWD